MNVSDDLCLFFLKFMVIQESNTLKEIVFFI